MRDRDPPRLSELRSDQPDGLRRALVEARRAGPDSAARARIALGVSSAVDRAPRGRTPSGGRLRPLAASAGLVTIAAVGLLAWRARPAVDVAEVMAPAAAPAAVAAAAPSAETVPAPPAEAPADETTAARPPRPAPRPMLGATARRVNARQGAAPATPRPAPLPSEGELLRRAQEALRASPTETLALVRQHATLYPSGVLAQERDVIAIEALEHLGRIDEARSAARAFLANHADSPHRAHVEALLRRPNPSSPRQ